MKFLILIIPLIIIGCTTSTSVQKLGYWQGSYTKSVSFWQCVEIFTPYKNKEC